MCSIYVFIHLHWTTILMYWRVPEINRSGKSIKIKSFLQDNCCCLLGPFGPFLHWPSPEFAGWFNPLYWHLGVSEVWRWCITNTITPKLPSSNRSQFGSKHVTLHEIWGWFPYDKGISTSRWICSAFKALEAVNVSKSWGKNMWSVATKWWRQLWWRV